MVIRKPEIKVLEYSDKSLEIEIIGEGHTLCNLIVDYLLRDPEVYFAHYRIDHPLTGIPKLYLRTRNEDPLTVLRRVIRKISDDLDNLAKEWERELGRL